MGTAGGGIQSYRSRQDVKKAAMMFRVSDRIRHALYNKCNEHVTKGGWCEWMRVEGGCRGPSYVLKVLLI